jgi:ABC-type transport system involved in cytochrome c biogenesis permease component
MNSIMTIAMPLYIPVILHVAKMMEALAAKKPMYTWLAAVTGSQWYP